MKDLIAKLTAATGPDRDLDCAIGCAIGAFTPYPPRYAGEGVRFARVCGDGSHSLPGQAPDMLVPQYTTSTDAALTLIPKGCDWLVGKGQCTEAEPPFGAQIFPPNSGFGVHMPPPLGDGEGPTLAIAICIAALKVTKAGA